MLGYIPALILQCIGVMIPLIGIIVLLKKGQGRTNTFLVMANFGAMMMNWGYLQLMRASDYMVAVSIYKFQYIGSVLFYLFFILFIKSYFSRDKKIKMFSLCYAAFFIIEAGALVAVLQDSPLAFSDIKVNFKGDDGSLYSYNISVEKNGMEIISVPDLRPDTGDDDDISGSVDGMENTDDPKDTGHFSRDKKYAAVHLGNGTILRIRYVNLTVAMLVAIIVSAINYVRRKSRDERHKIGHLIFSEAVALISLGISIVGTHAFNVAPLLVSASAICMICGTANGNLFTITDRGKGWVLDHSENIFAIFDSEYRFLDANDYAKKVFPILAETPRYAIISDEQKNIMMNDDSDIEWMGKYYAKKKAPIEVNGKVIGYSVMLIEVTERYELIRQLEEERQKAIDANQAKSNFMSNMSHEIRTPMNAIVGMTEIMLRHEQDSFNLEYLTNIKNSGNALLSVVNDILDFSKIESGKLEIIPHEYEIMSVLNDLSMIFLNRIGEKPIKLLYDIDPGLPVRLFGDSDRIRQILLNVVNNGIKYTDEGYVKLSIDMEYLSDDEIMLNCSVEDTGIGIKEEDISKIFSNFSQVDTKKNRGKEGTGLGLSIAKQLVSAMGGELTVESVYGRGSVFSFGMKQKVIDPEPAAYIRTDRDIYVSAVLTSTEALNVFKKLAAAYDNVHFVEEEDILSRRAERVDHIFADRNVMCRQPASDEQNEIIEHYKPEIITLQNPMYEQCGEGLTVINEPLYSLNFCLAINHEVLNFRQDQEKLMSFTAPEARILIVDDNEMNRKVTAGLLEPVNMKIDLAVDGRHALEKIRNNRYDLVFMDHMMPVMDGVEATEAVKAMAEESGDDYYRDLPIIALSANALTEARDQFLKAGMVDFLAKPIKTKELFRIVKKYLSSDKIIESDTDIIENIVSDDMDLPEIRGLDTAAGVEYSGGLDLFLSLLGDFYKLVDRKAAKIENCLADGAVRDFTIEVHALKNTSRMIGALELSDMFYELEKAGNAGDMEVIESLTPKTLELYRSYKEVLLPYAVRDNEEKEQMPEAEIIECIKALKEAMDSFDLDGADIEMKKLEDAGMPEELRPQIEDLAALVADVAMEDVMALCDSILASMA